MFGDVTRELLCEPDLDVTRRAVTAFAKRVANLDSQERKDRYLKFVDATSLTGDILSAASIRANGFRGATKLDHVPEKVIVLTNYEDEALVIRALQESDVQGVVIGPLLWYAHKTTTVWIADSLDGWSTVQLCLLLLCKDPHQIVSLGQVGVSAFAPRAPPDPLAFCDGHKYGNTKFKTKGERLMAASQFKDAMVDFFGGVPELSYVNQQWDDVSAARLALILPICISLKSLSLAGCGLTATGLLSILEVCVNHAALPKLRSFRLDGNFLIKDDGANILVAALQQAALPSLFRLSVMDCGFNANTARNLKHICSQRRVAIFL